MEDNLLTIQTLGQTITGYQSQIDFLQAQLDAVLQKTLQQQDEICRLQQIIDEQTQRRKTTAEQSFCTIDAGQPDEIAQLPLAKEVY